MLIHSLAIILAALSFQAFAKTLPPTQAWPMSDRNVISGLEDEDRYFLSAEITHSKDISKYIEFSLFPNIWDDRNDKKCELSNLRASATTVIYVEGQAINVSITCRSFEDGIKFYSILPTSQSARDFIEKLFRVRVDRVKVEIVGIVFYLTSRGFSEAWNSVSEDVL